MTIEIELTLGYKAIVDNEHEDLAEYNWYAHFCSGYAGDGKYMAARKIQKGNNKSTTLLMHRVIMSRVLDRPLLRSEKVDHIHGNPLDNRRSELRLATTSQNAMNTGKFCTNTSGYKGVSWNKSNNKWSAKITINRKQKHLGYFTLPVDAAIAYNYAARHYFGEFAQFNDIPRWEQAEPLSPLKMSKSGYRGVTHESRWRAAIKVNGKHISLGQFDTPLEAHRAYCEYAIRCHGDRANFGANSPFTPADFVGEIEAIARGETP